jgi:hypothetical protein
MKPVDFVKAIGVAFLVLAIDLAVSFLAVIVYAQLIGPGQTQAFYNAAALTIGPWSSHIAGPVIFLSAGYLFGRRGGERNPLKFAGAFCAAYAAITLTMLVSIGTLEAAWREGVILSMGIKFVGALIGAFLAARIALGARSAG